jgi:hypothetical protein
MDFHRYSFIKQTEDWRAGTLLKVIPQQSSGKRNFSLSPRRYQPQHLALPFSLTKPALYYSETL